MFVVVGVFCASSRGFSITKLQPYPDPKEAIFLQCSLIVFRSFTYILNIGP